MEMKRVDTVDLRVYNGPAVFVCGDAEIILEPNKENGERDVIYRDGQAISKTFKYAGPIKVGDCLVASPLLPGSKKLFLDAIYVPA